jgi:lycopene cyclase domain-containing protein
MGFLESKYLYLGLLVASISYPLAQSFEWRIQLYKNWKSLLLSILIMMSLFIPWDVWFTREGVWWFRKDYTLGFTIFDLPIEEWLFFIIVPYACVFIYEVLNFYIKKDIFRLVSIPFFITLGLMLLIFSFTYFPKYYTSFTFGLTGIFCLVFAFLRPTWLGRFLLMYLVSFIPFLLVNGVLTGCFIKAPVVNYNPNEIIGFRIITIPIEDYIYNLLMLLIVIFFFEKFRKTNRLKKHQYNSGL